jgi:Protein of unknown function (DUF2917)
MREAVRHSMLLSEGGIVQLRNGAGLRIAVARGQIWITQEGDPRDVVLESGQSVRIERNGLTLIEALQPSRFALLAARDRDRLEPSATFSLAA